MKRRAWIAALGVRVLFAGRRLEALRAGVRGTVAFGTGVVASVVLGGSAHAASLDPALSRLVVAPECHAREAADGSFTVDLGTIVDDEATRSAIADKYRALGLPPSDGLCLADGAAFKKLVNQWGFALAPNAMFGARSTGLGGFHVGVQASYTAIEHRADYWRLGSQGARTSAGAAATSGAPPRLISQYGVNIQKSFGFGIEAFGTVGFIPNSSLINGGADVRFALLEGFRSGVLGYIPDVSVGGGIRTITGTSQLQLTTVAAEARLSKPLAIDGASVLTPIVGYQYVWIFGRSGVIDLTPATDPLQYCGYAGQNIPRGGDDAVADGQAICAGGTSLDYNNNVVFQQANLERQRLLFGLSYRYEFFTAAAQLITDLLAPADAQNTRSDERALSTCDKDGCRSMPRQWQLAFELGVAF